MKPLRYLLIATCVLALPNTCFPQKANAWLTYGQSVFIYSPGVEGNYFFNKHLGLQAGAAIYIQDCDRDRIANITDDYRFNFHSANLGMAGILIHKDKHLAGITAGCKIYYGPEFEILEYYEKGGYHIYFDASALRPAYGLDLGIFYSFGRISGIIKFDTARKKIRCGIGYTFGR